VSAITAAITGLKKANMDKRYRFPSMIVQYAVWLYCRFDPSYRDIEDSLAARGVNGTCQAFRLRYMRRGFEAVYETAISWFQELARLPVRRKSPSK
jgi:hypothetical protein